VPASSGKVVVAMSGGVDSSVAAALLVEQGYQVIGLMLRLWSEGGRSEENRCCTPDSMALARRVAAQLKIPFYAVDAQQLFRDQVVQYFIQGYTAGITPNPCLACNRQVRWGFLLERAIALGAQSMATGHYARLVPDGAGKIRLLKGADPQKDQSYVLHFLGQPDLKRTLFPLGELTKPQVREIARKMGLPVAEKPDSQDLCFLGVDDYRNFLLRHAPEVEKPGPIFRVTGELIGEHRGLAFYTIGQRKGLGITSHDPLYVIAKDGSRNALLIGNADQLGSDRLSAGEVNWIAGEPPSAPFRAQVKIRYKAQVAWAKVIPNGQDRVQVQFEQPVRDITTGQAVVFYNEEECLGGGIIQE
jgi:tRNA-uridine 2-sulfurtransferase